MTEMIAPAAAALDPADKQAYASDLLAWSRSLDEHGLTFAEWQERERMRESFDHVLVGAAAC